MYAIGEPLWNKSDLNISISGPVEGSEKDGSISAPEAKRWGWPNTSPQSGLWANLEIISAWA
jgi:hypothetical protein